MGEERDARFVDGRDVAVEVRFEDDLSRRVEEDMEVRREEDDDSCPAP